MSVSRPRVRDHAGEVPLATWERFAETDPLTPRAVEQMVLGVSTRNYRRSIEPAPPGTKTRGASKSAVSWRFVAETTKQLAETMTADLSSLAVAAVMIDGIHVGEHVVIIALGIDDAGEKHVLGRYDGATKNATVCSALLLDLTSRGLRADRAMLFVIDGGRALAKAVRSVFGKRALVQRCQVHKRRNVLDHLPEEMKQRTGRAISTAYKCTDAARAKRMLNGIAKQLEKKHPSAAASLREGLDGTLTVMNFGLPATLERTLSTTNPLEFINGRIRKTTHNVDRWDGGLMVLRWLAVALREAAKTFRKLRGYKGMHLLVAALRAHDLTLDPKTIDRASRAA